MSEEKPKKVIRPKCVYNVTPWNYKGPSLFLNRTQLGQSIFYFRGEEGKDYSYPKYFRYELSLKETKDLIKWLQKCVSYMER